MRSVRIRCLRRNRPSDPGSGSFYPCARSTGSESPLNRKWEFPWQNKKRAEFGPASKEKMPAGQTEP